MELNKEDLVWVLRRIPKSLFDLMKERGYDIVLAGGFIRACVTNEKPSDIDLFSRDKDKAELFARIIYGSIASHRIIQTDNAYTILGVGKYPIQFIHKWTYDSPDRILPSFDFTIAKAAVFYNGQQWTSMCSDRFYPDIAAKRLVYTKPNRIEEVGGSMLRVLKFYQRGYRIPLDSLGAVVARLISAVHFERTGEDEDERARVITGLLREVDPSVDPTHISHLPSQKENEQILQGDSNEQDTESESQTGSEGGTVS